MSRRLLALLALSAALAAASTSCGGSDPAPDAGLPSDASIRDATVPADAGPGLDATSSADVGPGLDAAPVDERGFAIRVPQERTIPGKDFQGNPITAKAWDIDYVCTFRYGAADGFVYVRADAVEDRLMGGGRIYATRGGWMSFAKVVTAAQNPSYDYGGNHHNDSVDVDYQGKTFRYYHSSFGFGWRSCLPPDCLQVLQGLTVIEDGCGADRKLPVVCVEVDHDGKVAPLVDTFQKCLGDPNAYDAGR